MAAITQVSNEEAIKIIEDRVPLGLFYTIEGDKYIGIDNTDGNAWTEEFEYHQAMVNWLIGEE